MNLRHPNLTDADAEAFLRTISGIPAYDRSEDLPAIQARPFPPYGLSRAQRVRWYELVVDEGWSINDALVHVRGLK